MLEALGAFHPQIVHTPIALLIFSALFAIAGRLLDRDWVRKASTLLLVFGFLGAFAAVRSGESAEEVPEHQGVPREAIEAHETPAKIAMITAGVALAALAIATRLKGGLAGVVSGLALMLQIVAAIFVGVAGHRGGKLVYDHAARVKMNGEYVRPLRADHDDASRTNEHERDRTP